MNCNTAHTKFIFYLDNELNYSEKQDFEKHLKYCSSCQKLFNDIKATYNQTDIPKLSDNFTQNVMDYSFSSNKQTRSLQHFIRFTRNIAAVILFMLVSLSTLLVISERNEQKYAKNEQPTTETEFINYYFADLEAYDVDNYYNETTEDK